MKENSALSEELLTDIIDIWESSDYNTFSFMNHVTESKGLTVKNALGIGKKGITHSMYTEDMRQPDYNENPSLKYSPWIEEVIIRMGEKIQVPIGYTPCPELLTMSQTDGHPLPFLCEPITTELFSTILKTNAGIQLSKLNNTYSRLGGAYNNGEIYGKEIFKNVAIFPLIATLSSTNPFEKPGNDSDWIRLISGFVIRAPYHAKRPTDRIMIITVELMPRTDEVTSLIYYINNALVYETDEFRYSNHTSKCYNERGSYI
uniref:Uncharacterized protein n=1 Tax=Heliothis virescens TaxID=7102 RepID=A0A2A4J613_HELVI